MMDPKLVQQAMNGNAKATEQLFTETYAKTYALAFRLLRNAQDAEDLVQEAYISAFLNLEHIHDPSKFDVWMKQIVSNRCKDLFKKKQPTLFTDLEAPEDEGPLEFEDTATTFSPEAVADREETARIVQTLMEQLPEEQRICLLMVDGAEMTSADAAGALGISESTVKSRVRYGRKKMEELVSDYEKKNNIRLHSLGPIAILGLLRWMQSSAAQPTAEAVSAVVQGVSSATSAATAAGTVTTAAVTAGKAGATSGGLGVAGKVIAGIIGAGVVATGAIAAVEPELLYPVDVLGLITPDPIQIVQKFEDSIDDWDYDDLMSCIDPEIVVQLDKNEEDWDGLLSKIGLRIPFADAVGFVKDLAGFEFDLDIGECVYYGDEYAVVKTDCEIATSLFDIDEGGPWAVCLRKIDGDWYMSTELPDYIIKQYYQ